MWLGPNAVLASAREGYGRYDVRLRDLGETLRRPVSARWLGDMAHGVAELAGDYSRRLVVRAARQLIPELTPADVEPGPRASERRR